jgi:hypothetical protein
MSKQPQPVSEPGTQQRTRNVQESLASTAAQDGRLATKQAVVPGATGSVVPVATSGPVSSPSSSKVAQVPSLAPQVSSRVHVPSPPSDVVPGSPVSVKVTRQSSATAAPAPAVTQEQISRSYVPSPTSQGLQSGPRTRPQVTRQASATLVSSTRSSPALTAPHPLAPRVRAPVASAPGPSGPLVSVVVTARDAGAAAASTVLDLLRQQHRHIEVVFVDDGSTDDTSQRIAAIKDSRVTIFRRPWKSGPAAARKLGLMQASGQFIVFLEAGTKPIIDLAGAVAYLARDITANGVSSVKGSTVGTVYRRAAVEHVGGFEGYAVPGDLEGRPTIGDLDDALAVKVTRIAVLPPPAIPTPPLSLTTTKAVKQSHD